MDKEIRAVTRLLKGGIGDTEEVFKHTARVTEIIFEISRQTGIRDYYTLNTKLYKKLRDPTVRSTITQSAILDGVAAAKAYRTHVKQGRNPVEPTFKNPVIKLNNQAWRLNEVAGGYIAKCNIGSRTHPRIVIVNVARNVAQRVSQHTLGELHLTPKSYSITYSERVPSVEKPYPEGKCTIAELVADIGRVNSEPKNVLAVDINVGNVTVGDDNNMVQFDLSGAVNGIVDAKTHVVRDKRNDLKYVRKKGRRISYTKEEARRERQKVVRGGNKLHGKLKRRHRNLKRSGETEAAKKVGVQMTRCIKDPKHSHKQRKDSKKGLVTKRTRTYEHQIHIVALCIIQWALATNSLLVLENLRGMHRSWSKQKGKFAKGLRRRFYSASMMKISDILYSKAPFAGVEALKMNPYHTSKLCAVCRNVLTGDYHTRFCRHCGISVNRDVNAVENMRRITAYTRYGLVRAIPDEARRTPDVMYHSGVLVHSGCNRRANGLRKLTW